MTIEAVSRRCGPLLLLIVSIIWAGAPAVSEPPAHPAKEGPECAVIRVPVKTGQASVDLPTTGRKRWLVVVSSVSPQPGPFPITIRASSTSTPRPVQTLPAEPNRPPDLIQHIPPPTRATPARLPSKERTFSLMVRAGDPTSASNYVPVRATLRAVGKQVQVYVDSRERDAVDDARLRAIVETFDAEIVPASERLRGLADDTDGDGRFTILLSGWLAHLGGGRLAVDGFVRGADLDPEVQPPFGNRCDMLYLSTSLAAGPYMKTILAHEYAHAVTFSRKRLSRPASGSAEEEGWLDEAISHLVEDQHGFSRGNIDYRVDAFLAEPESYRLVVDDYFRADLFRSHGHRGATYLFLRWCERQFGPELVPTLMASPLRGVENLEHATGRSFSDLYREWSLSLAGDLVSARSAETDAPATPHQTHLLANDSVASWRAEGTSSRFFVVAPADRDAIRLEVDAPADSLLQVTAAPIPDDRSLLELTPRRPGTALVLGVRHKSGPPVVLDSLTWWDRANPVASHAELKGDALTNASGRSRISEGETLRLQAAPVEGFHNAWTFKLRGHDPSGKAVTAWAVCPPAADEPATETLAE